MNEAEKQKIWSLKNDIDKSCEMALEDLAKHNYVKTVCSILAIKEIIKAFYKDNAN